MYKYANDDQLEFIHEGHRIIFDSYEARYAIICDVNTKELTNVDPGSHVHRPKSTQGYFQTVY